MTGYSVEILKDLRAKTNASLADCKKVLEETHGDVEKSEKLLKTRGLAVAEKKLGRTAREGDIASYIHSNGKIGVLVELYCETDFVARAPEFKQLAHDLALHIAASAPKYVSRQDIPNEILEEEKRIISQDFAKSGKPQQIIDKIVSGKLTALEAEITLLGQPFVKDPDRTVQQVITEAIAKFGEKIAVGRFTRLTLGQN